MIYFDKVSHWYIILDSTFRSKKFLNNTVLAKTFAVLVRGKQCKLFTCCCIQPFNLKKIDCVSIFLYRCQGIVLYPVQMSDQRTQNILQFYCCRNTMSPNEDQASYLDQQSLYVLFHLSHEHFG